MTDEARAEAVILALLQARGSAKSICPSEAARALAGEAPGEAWRAELGLVRRVALRLGAAGRIDVLRKGKRVADVAEVKGVIRLRAARGATDEADEAAEERLSSPASKRDV